MALHENVEVAGRYRLLRPLGEGGMGQVWVARHLELDVDMALKLIRSARAESERAEQRFRREARAAAKLKSPYIARIHDFGRWEGHLYLVMELLEGEDLAARLEHGPMALEETALVVTQLSRALGVIHDADIVHRDLKPSNIFLTEAGGELVTKVLDFGIAKAIDVPGDTTETGNAIGSPGYMSPEQAVGDPVDTRSDLWSLACVTYEMLAGQLPFAGSTPVRLYTEIAAGNVRPFPTEDEHRDAAMAFFRRALARDRERRFPTAASFLAAFHDAFGLPAPEAKAPRRREPVAVAPRDTSTQTGRVTSTLEGASSRRDEGRPATERRRGVLWTMLGAGLAVAVVAWVFRAPSDATEPTTPEEPSAASSSSVPDATNEPPATEGSSPPAPTVDDTTSAPTTASRAEPPTREPPAREPPRFTTPRPAPAPAPSAAPTPPKSPPATPTAAPSVDPFSGLPLPE